jgi:PAS domain-containing protein
MSYTPFSIVYANAAFFRLSGLPSEKIIGSGFASIIENHAKDDALRPVRLSDCMASSDSGHHRKMQIIQDSDNSSREPVERYFKVLPVVSKRPLNGKEVSYVTHLAVDLLGESDGVLLGLNYSSDANMAVGVMG